MHDPQASLSDALAVRYMSAVGIVCLIYDHLLTFESERQAIWANKNTHVLSKVGFFTNRYGSEALGLYVAYTVVKISMLRCVTFAWIFIMVIPIFVTISHFAVIFRIYYIWDRRRTIGYILTASFVFFISVICVLAVLTGLRVRPSVIYLVPFKSCYITTKPKEYPATLAVISLYDFFLIILTIFNSLEVPRRHDVEIIRSLQNDTAKAFLLLFVLRLSNMAMAISGKLSDAIALLLIVWLLCAVINSHLQIRLETLPKPGQSATPAALEMLTLPNINHSTDSELPIWETYGRKDSQRLV